MPRLSSLQIWAMIAGFIFFLSIGAGPLLGHLTPYVISYQYQSQFTPLTTAFISHCNIISEILISFVGFLLPIFSVKIDQPKFILQNGSIFLFFLYLSSHLIYYELFIGCFIICIVIGILLFQSILAIISQNLKEYTNLSRGMVLAGFPIGNAISNYLCYLFINPLNKKPSYLNQTKENQFEINVAHNLPFGIRMISLQQFGLLAFGYVVLEITIRKLNEKNCQVSLLINPPAALKPQENSTLIKEINQFSNDLNTLNQNQTVRVQENSEFTTKINKQQNCSFTPIDKTECPEQKDDDEAIKLNGSHSSMSQIESPRQKTQENTTIFSEIKIKTKSVGLLFLKRDTQFVAGLWFFSVPLCYFFTFFWKKYGFSFNQTDHYLSTTKTVGLISSGLIRPVWGIILDIFNYKKVLQLLLVMGLLTTLIFQYFSSNSLILAFDLIAQRLTFSGLMVELVSLNFILFTKEESGIIQSITNFSQTISTISSSQIFGLDLGYDNLFILFCFCAILSICFVHFLPNKENKKAKDKEKSH